MPARVFKKDEKEELKRRMLEAGLILIKKYGLVHMSISKITDAAKIGTSTFYNFWNNKNEYIKDLSEYNEKKLMAGIMNGRTRAGIHEVREYLYALVNREISIAPYITLADEMKIFGSTPDSEMESAKTRDLLGMIDGADQNADTLLIANLIKILALTSESENELHEAAYARTIDSLIDIILRQIFGD